jgi:prepilin-type N-terminal cleavage/methylation domain-containing protein
MRTRKAVLNSQQSGFTLIELLIVVALIAIFATLVLPNVAHYRHKAAVAAAQGTAHCLETGLAGFNPQSSDPVERYPIGIADQSSLVNAANQIGCKMSPSASYQPVDWWGCWMTIVCPDGSVIRTTCNVDPICTGGPPHNVDYDMTLRVHGYADTVTISSSNALETLSPLVR